MKSKRIFFIIGVFLFIIGICSYIGLYSQSKININQVDKQYLSNIQISTIGTKTIDKIIDNQPYENMEAINAVSGIGDVKYNTLSKVFCTYDTCRFQIYILGIIISVLCICIGTLLIIFYCIAKEKEEIKHRRLSKELKQSLESHIKKE